MATPFKQIYNKFLSMIEDVDMAKLTDIELEEILNIYLDRAIALDFKVCKKDLNDIDLELGQFNQTLTKEEEWIIALGMTLSWLEPNIKRESLMRAAITDKDFNESSHANQLKELLNLEERILDKLEKYKISYSYNDFEGYF